MPITETVLGKAPTDGPDKAAVAAEVITLPNQKIKFV